MDFVRYINSIVYINLVNGFYYSGKVVDATNEDITLIDKCGKRVSLSKDAILSMRELG